MSAVNKGLQVHSMIPSIYNDPEMLKKIRAQHVYLKDNYEKYFKRYGISRTEMMIVMGPLLSVDVLAGTDILPYLE